MIRNVLIIDQDSCCFCYRTLSKSTKFEVMGSSCFQARGGWWSDSFGDIESAAFSGTSEAKPK
jgi:hypothetical protein